MLVIGVLHKKGLRCFLGGAFFFIILLGPPQTLADRNLGALSPVATIAYIKNRIASISPSAPSDKEPLWIALSANPDAHYFIEEILLPVFIERIWINAQSRMNPDTKTIPLSIISDTSTNRPFPRFS